MYQLSSSFSRSCMRRTHSAVISMNAMFCLRLYFQFFRGGAPGEKPCMTNIRKSLNTVMGLYPHETEKSLIRFSSGHISRGMSYPAICSAFYGFHSYAYGQPVSFMVCLCFAGAPPRKERCISPSAAFHSVAGRILFHAGSPKYQRPPVQSVEQFSLQQSGQFSSSFSERVMPSHG